MNGVHALDVDAPASADLSAIFALPGSTGPEDQVAATVNLGSLAEGETYVAVANGVIGENFSENPDQRNIDFTVFAFNKIRESARDSNQITVNQFLDEIFKGGYFYFEYGKKIQIKKN